MEGGHYIPPTPPFPQFCYWTEEEKKLFDVLIADADLSAMDLFETIAVQIPGKTADQVEEYFHSIIPKVDDISGNGLVPDSGKTIVVSNDDEAESSWRPIRRRRQAPNNRARRHHDPWSETEHRLFVLGLDYHGRSWKSIARHYVKTKTACQVASHAQKYFMRLKKPEFYAGKRYSILDIHTFDQYLRPKLRFYYKPIAPSPVPPSPPIYLPQVDSNIFVGTSRMPNKCISASFYPIEDHYYFLPQNVTNPLFGPPPMSNGNEAGPSMSYPESPSNYLLDEPLQDDFLDSANFMQ